MASSSVSLSKSGSGRVRPLWSGERVRGVLPRRFFGRETLFVARELLGKVLLVRSRPELPFDDPRAGVTGGRVVETEAYTGNDPASHSFRGKTVRSAVMFGEPGVAYVYFIYGMYEMLNFVTEKKGIPGAVLIRAIEPLIGTELMTQRRYQKVVTTLASGPGKLCRAMGIERIHNGEKLQGPTLYVVDDQFQVAEILVSPRVGIRQAADWMWRFYLKDSLFVSRVPQNTQGRPWLPR